MDISVAIITNFKKATFLKLKENKKNILPRVFWFSVYFNNVKNPI